MIDQQFTLQFLTQDQLGNISRTWATDKVVLQAEPLIARAVLDKVLEQAANGNVPVSVLLEMRDGLHG